MTLAIMALTAAGVCSVRLRRLCAFHPGAGRAHGGGRRWPQHAGRPDRAGVARPCRLLRDRRLHGGDPDHQRRELLDGVPVGRPHRRRHRGFAGASRFACRVGPISRWSQSHSPSSSSTARSNGATLTGGQNGLMGLVPPQSPDNHLPSVRWRCSRQCLRGFRSFCSTALPRAPGARQWWRCGTPKSRRARSGSTRLRQDRGICHVGVIRGPRRRDLRAAVDVRRAGLVSVLAVDPVSARSDRRRRGLGAGSGRWVRSSVMLPELLSGLAEYRLLFFGGLLLVVLWIAPEGRVGTLARFARRTDPARLMRRQFRPCRVLRNGRSAARTGGVATSASRSAASRPRQALASSPSPARSPA